MATHTMATGQTAKKLGNAGRCSPVLDGNAGHGAGQAEVLGVVGPLDAVELDERQLGGVVLGHGRDNVLDQVGLLLRLGV
jgi:hypothetical protein